MLVSGPKRGGLFSWWCIRFSIIAAGGSPVRITPHDGNELPEFDALVLSGGADIDPVLYDAPLPEEPTSESTSWFFWPFRMLLSLFLFLIRTVMSVKDDDRRIDTERDQLELTILSKAARHSKPILGICRGAQLINVFFGGTLNQSIKDFYNETPHIRSFLPKKRIEISAASLLYEILQRETCWVNALHDQSIKDLGEYLTVCACESNGVIQGIEHLTMPYILGVQWHPEYIFYRKEQRKLFLRLISAANVAKIRGQAAPLFEKNRTFSLACESTGGLLARKEVVKDPLFDTSDRRAGPHSFLLPASFRP